MLHMLEVESAGGDLQITELSCRNSEPEPYPVSLFLPSSASALSSPQCQQEDTCHLLSQLLGSAGPSQHALHTHHALHPTQTGGTKCTNTDLAAGSLFAPAPRLQRAFPERHHSTAEGTALPKTELGRFVGASCSYLHFQRKKKKTLLKIDRELTSTVHKPFGSETPACVICNKDVYTNL